MTEAASPGPVRTRRSRKAAPLEPAEAAVGPTDISDPLLRHEVKRAFVWIGMVGLVALAVLAVSVAMSVTGVTLRLIVRVAVLPALSVTVTVKLSAPW